VLDCNVPRLPRDPDDAGARRGVDDRAAATLLHQRDLVLHAQKHAAQIARGHAVEILLAKVRQRDMLLLDPCAVEGDVDAAEGLDGPVERGADVVALRYIAGDPDGAASRCLPLPRSL
jgi:hypothetical protein